MMARRLGKTISKTAALHQGLLMHEGSEGWPVWADPTGELLLLQLLKKLILVLI